MKAEPILAPRERPDQFRVRLPRIVYHSSQFSTEEWKYLFHQSGYSLRRIHSLYEIHAIPEALSVILLDDYLVNEKELQQLEDHCRDGIPVSFVSVLPPDGEAAPYGELSEMAAGVLQTPFTSGALAFSLRVAFRHAENRLAIYQEKIRGEIVSRNLENLTQIGIALSAENDNHRLLDLILTRSRELTNADAGSLYLVEEQPEGEKNLRFKHTQNDSKTIPFREFVMPASKASISGYVALTGETLNIADVYRIPTGVEYEFNQSFDLSVGYRSKSMLVVPMVDHKKEIIGVLQLINAKMSPDSRLSNPEIAEKEVISFDPAIQSIIQSLASQAAVALEKTMLIESIENTFEGLVKASAHAIEQRDPTTSGHSERVTELTCALARAVNETKEGRYAEVAFSEEQMKELRYAGLLHDFGKIAVQEQILLKKNKLYPVEREAIKNRFYSIMQLTHGEFHEKIVQCALEGDKKGVEALREECGRKIGEIQAHLDLILRADVPTMIPEGDFVELQRVGKMNYRDADGEEKPYLTPREIHALSLKKGNLTDEERKEIESHASQSYDFLVQIPWTKELRGIPDIAHGHHEKLNGEGYPLGLSYDEIPLQAKIMCICDIFDALTAADRPYKKAASLEQAIQILRWEVKDGHLCPELVDIFVKRKIYRTVETFRNADYIDPDL